MRTKLLKILSVNLFVLAFLLIFADAVLVLFNSINYAPRYRYPSPGFHHGLIPDSHTVDVWGKEYSVSVSPTGYRFSGDKRSLANRKSNLLDIIILGDSFAESVGVNWIHSFSGLLEKGGLSLVNQGVVSFSPYLSNSRNAYYSKLGFRSNVYVHFVDQSDLQDDIHYECVEKYRTPALWNTKLLDEERHAYQGARPSLVARLNHGLSKSRIVWRAYTKFIDPSASSSIIFDSWPFKDLLAPRQRYSLRDDRLGSGKDINLGMLDEAVKFKFEQSSGVDKPLRSICSDSLASNLPWSDNSSFQQVRMNLLTSKSNVNSDLLELMMRNTLRNISEIRQTISAHAPYVLVTYPWPVHFDPTTRNLSSRYVDHVNSIEAFAKSEPNLHHCDLTPFMTDSSLYISGDVHWSEKGHAVVADNLRKCLNKFL